MRTFALVSILVCVGVFVPFDRSASGASDRNWFMAFCNDGDGPLSAWMSTRNEAFLAARDHERAAPGHRWEMLVQHGATSVRPPACALLTDGEKPDTVKLQNLCGDCRTFTISRTTADAVKKTKQFTLKGKGQRHFRKIEGAVISASLEADCPN